jgi:MFS family permease
VSRRSAAGVRGRASRRAIVGALGLGAASGANILNVGALPDHLAAAYGVSLATVGLFTTALLVVHTASQIPGGSLIDRFGARRVGLLGLVAAAFGNTLISVTPDPVLALGLRGFIGISTGVSFVAGIDYIRAAGGSSLAQGLFGGVAMGGGGLALALVPLLEPALDWRAPFVFGVVVSFAAAVILASGPTDAAERHHAAGGRAPALGLALDRRLARIVVLHAATFGSGLLIGNWVVALLVRHGHRPGVAGAIGSLTLGLTIVSRPLGGWLLQHRPAATRPALAASLLVGSIGCAGLALRGPTSVTVIAAIAVGLGAGLAFAPVMMSVVRIRPDAPGAAVGAVNMWGNVVVLTATPLLGLTFGLPGEGRLGFIALAVVWAAALLALPTSHQLGLDAGEVPAARPSR